MTAGPPVGADLDARSGPTTPAPAGVGLGVAVLWGVGAQLAAAATSGLAGSDLLAREADPSPALVLTLAVGALGAVSAGGLLRSGRDLAHKGTVVLGAGMALAGATRLPSSISALLDGSPWPAVTTAILVMTGPMIAWRLTRPESRRWFRTVAPPEARRRHDARWAVGTAAIAAPLGLLVGSYPDTNSIC